MIDPVRSAVLGMGDQWDQIRLEHFEVNRGIVHCFRIAAKVDASDNESFATDQLCGGVRCKICPVWPSQTPAKGVETPVEHFNIPY
jgi:hypothetical protein